MKAFFRMLMCAAALFAVGMSHGCSDDETKDTPTGGQSSMSVSVKGVELGAATLTLTTSGITEAAYKFYETAPDSAPEAVVIFQSGEKVACVDGQQDIRISGLQPATTYYVYIAGQTANDYHAEVLSIEVTTGNATDIVNLLEVGPTNYNIALNLPAEVKERGNVVRYTICNLYWYNTMRSYGFVGVPYCDAALFNMDNAYFGDDEESITINHNMDNLYGEDEDGEEILIHYPIAPGQPTVLILGEFTHSGDPMDLDNYGHDWTVPMFDRKGADRTENFGDDAFWTGYHSRTQFTTQHAEKLDATVNIEVSNVSSIRAMVTLTPDEEVAIYNMLCVPDDVYNTIISRLGDESLLQWFVSSYEAAAESLGSLTGKTVVNLEEKYWINPETTYHIMVVGMSGELGSPQCFVHKTFTTPAKSLPAPEVVVTAIPAPNGEESPYEVWFNVKCPTGDAVTGCFAANTVREWEMMRNQNMSYRDLIQLGYQLDPRVIANEINKPEGANFSFPTLEGETFRMGVMLANEEQTYNDPDVEGSTAIADATSSYLPEKERVESELFTALEGVWTISGKVREWDGSQNTYREEPMKSKVTISGGIEYPETLGQNVYDIYKGLDKDEKATDELYADFKQQADAYNKRLRGQNRMLLVGFNSEDPVLAPMSAFEGFYFEDYSGYDNATILYDFGPKWYFEIRNGDRIAVPFNSDRLAPMSNWRGYPCYMSGLTDDGNFYYYTVGENSSTLYFPVVVSEDRNTITIKPLEMETTDENGKKISMVLYPNALYNTVNGMGIANPAYVSELTLTRGWTEPEQGTPAAVSTGGYRSMAKAVIESVQMPNVKSHAGRITSFEDAEPVTRITMAPATIEDIDSRFMRGAGFIK